MMPAIDIAKYIITKCSNDKKFINVFTLMDILYFLQTTYIALYNKLLFEEEFKAGGVGAYIDSVYNFFACNAAMLIFSTYNDIKIKDPKIKKFIDSYVDQLREIDQLKLRILVYPPLSAYKIVYDDKKGYKQTIPNSLLLKLKK